MSAAVDDEETSLYKFARGLYNTGELLLYDDKHDIGYFTYYNRPHVYHGKLEKDHPSPLHHWPVGVIFMFAGQMLGIVDTLNQMKLGMQEESFNTDIK